MNLFVIALEALVLLAVVWRAAKWHGRLLQAERQHRELWDQVDQLEHEQAAATRTGLRAPSVEPMGPTTLFRGSRALYTLSALDATDMLLLTRYVKDREEPGTALYEAACRVRGIGLRAVDNLGIGAHDLARRGQ